MPPHTTPAAPTTRAGAPFMPTNTILVEAFCIYCAKVWQQAGLFFAFLAFIPFSGLLGSLFNSLCNRCGILCRALTRSRAIYACSPVLQYCAWTHGQPMLAASIISPARNHSTLIVRHSTQAPTVLRTARLSTDFSPLRYVGVAGSDAVPPRAACVPCCTRKFDEHNAQAFCA